MKIAQRRTQSCTYLQSLFYDAVRCCSTTNVVCLRFWGFQLYYLSFHCIAYINNKYRGHYFWIVLIRSIWQSRVTLEGSLIKKIREINCFECVSDSEKLILDSSLKKQQYNILSIKPAIDVLK